MVKEACSHRLLRPLVHHHLANGVRVHGAVALLLMIILLALLVAHRIQSRVEKSMLLMMVLLFKSRLVHVVAGVHLGHGLEITASVRRSVLLLRTGVMII